MTWWVLQNVVIIAALAAAVAIACRAARIGPVARHALWVLVLVKFITPPLVVWPWAVPDVLGIAVLDSPMTQRQIAPGVVPGLDPAPTASRGDGDVDVSPARLDALTAEQPSSRAWLESGAVLWPWIFGVWAVGSLCLLGIEGVRLARLARRVRTASPASPDIVQRVAELSARLGIQPVRVVTIAGTTSPAVWCLHRPVLLWPADLPTDSSDACLDGLLVHELAHVKRGDHLIGWIELIAGVLWWWNPLFWLVRSARREQAELACDAWVISAVPNGRRAYAESLLTLSGAAIRRASPTSIAVIGVHATSRRVLERRLVMIMKGRAPLRLPLPGLLALTLIAGATMPAWAIGEPQQTLPPQTAPPTSVTPPPARPQTVPPPSTRPVTRQTPPPTSFPQHKLQRRGLYTDALDTLPEDGQQLLQDFTKEREAIQAEADKRIEARRETVVKALEALQAEYAKSGKLDEAVAIRDYLRAGGPRDSQFSLFQKGR